MKEQKITNNIKAPNNDLEVLKKHFSHCFDANGKFQIAKLQQSLEEKEANFSSESYGLEWLGKSYARILASDAATTLLKEDEAHNKKSENADAQNLLLKGDNLEVLKHLSNAYHEKIKMIYIDPPYNTGSDGFVYKDDRNFKVSELQYLAGIDGEKAKRIYDFTRSSNSHSAWLTFMYPRLYIAKRLLQDDGVIFISIDDNEVAQLRILMDDIFGEENLIGQIANTNNPKGRSDDKFVATAHEYLFIYAKNKDKTYWNGFEPEEKITIRYNKEDEGKKYREIDLRKTGDNDRKEDRPNLFYYFLYNEETKDFYPTKDEVIPDGYIQIFTSREDGALGNWRWDINNSITSMNILVPKYMSVRKKWGVFELDYLENKTSVKPTSSWTFKDINSERGSEQFVDLGFTK